MRVVIYSMLAAILLLACAVTVPRFSSWKPQARITAAQTQLATFATALDAFQVDTGSYPASSPMDTNGLVALVMPPPGVTNWSGPYLRDVPLDPWGNPYICEVPGRHNRGAYDLLCSGPDGRAGTSDDIRNWTEK